MLSPSALVPGFELAFRLRQPQPAAPRRALVLLHGVGGNENHLAVLADSVGDDVLVVLVRAPLQLAPGQHAWFNVSFGAEGPVIDHRRRQTHGRGLVEAAGIGPVGKDEAHLGRMLRIGHVSRERDHVRPRSGNEDGNAPAERVWPTAQSTPR